MPDFDDPFSPGFASEAAAFRAGNELGQGGGPTLSALVSQHPKLVQELRKFSPTETAAAFAGLLTVPELQANCLRLEALVRLTLLRASGRLKPTDTFLRRAFREIGKGYCGHSEDASEDVFVGAVRTDRGNFKVFEGLWEGGCYYLQRVLDTVARMPKGSGYDDLRDEIHALLTLSDLACDRAGLRRHQVGAEVPVDRLAPGITGASVGSVRRVRFSMDEIRQAGFDPLLLAPFLFRPQQRSSLADERLGSTSLERYPLLKKKEHIILVMPTAVSSAIRYLVVERMAEAGLLAQFGRGMAHQYARHLSSMQLLGGRIGAPVSFQYNGAAGFAGVVSRADDGRFLNFVFVADLLDDFENTGLAGFTPNPDEISDGIRIHVEEAHSKASATSGFVDGITVVVGCGIGRGLMAALRGHELPNWRVVSVSAYDLETLSWLPGFKPLSLWRLLDSEQQVVGFGTELGNIKGLLNMVGWARSLGGHLVPHGALPDNFTGMLMVDQSSQRELRREVAERFDPKVVQNVEGDWVRVRRDQQSDFADDQAAPLYAIEELDADGGFSSVYLAERRSWWGKIVIPKHISGHLAYQRWRVLTVWLARAAPKLDQLSGLPDRPVQWRAVFENVVGEKAERSAPLTFEQARGTITVAVDSADMTVTTTAAPIFENAFAHPENIAERALVDAMLEGFLRLASEDQRRRPALLAAVVPGPLARQAHAVPAQHFRDYVRATIPPSVVTIDKEDDTALRLGLGWIVRDRSEGSVIEGKEETTSYLRRLVTSLEDQLCSEIAQFERNGLLQKLLLNHEAAAADRDRWKRTAAAVLSLHEDRDATLKTMAEHDFGLNAVLQASRVLIEVANCEAPLGSGRSAGDLDLSRLMARAMLIFYTGGWSDAIRWEVMEPSLRITTLGNVHAKFDYMDAIVLPHAREISDARFGLAETNYPNLLKPAEPRASIDDVMDARFLAAWQEEFGTSLQNMRVLVDWLESRGIERGEALMSMERDDFTAVEAAGFELDPSTVNTLLEQLILPVRPRWRDLPTGFDKRDLWPWRYRRRLSLMRRPILSVGTGSQERLLVAPGLIRDVFVYMVANYHRGDFPAYQLTKAMRKWSGAQADERGAALTQEVATMLEGKGWKVETEIKPTKILSSGLDRDYGDVDVLAWDSNSGRVLIMECKDVQFRKTLGEIGEQLADFKGGYRSGGKPDYLRRHLDRVELLTQRRTGVQKFTGVSADLQIESHLVFKNPVPMRYALSRLASIVIVSTASEIEEWPAVSVQSQSQTGGHRC